MARRTRLAANVKDFQWAGRELMAQGLLTLHAGNLSIRRNARVFITRTGSRLGDLTPADIIETPADGRKPRHPRASMELPTHLAIYEATGAGAVLHAHPPSAIALSIVEDRIVPLDSEGAIILREVPVIRARRTVASVEVAAKAASLLQHHPVVVVASHGSFAVGRSLEEALSVTTTLEMSARIILLVRSLQGGDGPEARPWRRSR